MTPSHSVALQQIDIDGPLPPVTGTPAPVLVRLAGRPLGLLDVRGDLAPDDVAALVWARLGQYLQRALLDGGLEPVEQLTADGIGTGAGSTWAMERAELARHGPPVAVVVCTRDRPALLDQALTSVADVDYHDLEIVVVDSAPSAGATSDVVARHAAGRRRVRYVRELRPGLSWARNAGLATVERPFVAFTDDDVVVDANWVSELLRGFAGGAHVGCVTGQVLPRGIGNDVVRWREAYAGATKLGFQRRVFDRIAGGSTPAYPLTVGECGFGMNMAFRTEVLRAIGTFEPALGVGTRTGGGEDLAAFFEVLSAGHRLVYEPSAMVSHRHRATLDELEVQMRGWGRGLTAYLTHTATRHPLRAASIVARSGGGMVHAALSPRSTKNLAKPPDYPTVLTRGELAGMPAGPFSYVRARRDAARLRRGLRVG